MTKPKIILGRGGKNCECDVIISEASAVSRQHFTIRFAPELQAFEIENLSKNGILVNGEFLNPYSPPILLRSQADIGFGRTDPMKLMFILPTSNPTDTKKRDMASDKHVPLLQWIGETLLSKGHLTAKGIRKEVEKAHPELTKRLGSSQIIDSSIRHTLTQNDHIFQVLDSIELENNLDAPVMASGGKVTDAFFALKNDQKSRFYPVPTQKPNKNNQTGMPRDIGTSFSQRTMMTSNVKAGS